jgi:hypothetical protein
LAGQGTATFGYSRALAPLLWVFASIMALELVLMHLLVSALGSQVAALILSAISLAALVWTIHFIRSLQRCPVLVDEEGVTMRVGGLGTVRVPAAHISGLRCSWQREELKQRGVLNYALINYPNVMLELDPPLSTRRRTLVAIAHRLDDPAGFTAAITRLREGSA